MRVSAGFLRNSIINTLEGNDTRPTKDMVKEAIFSHLFDVTDKTFLDVFAGSGAISIEAFSRGCKELYLNDYNKKAYDVIKDNLDRLKITNYKLYNLECFKFLDLVKDKKFDYIFLDPPYNFKYYDEIFKYIYEHKMLKDSGVIILEISSDNDVKINYFNNYKGKKYGKSKIEYYKQ